jgi:hypothetical protein
VALRVFLMKFRIVAFLFITSLILIDVVLSIQIDLWLLRLVILLWLVSTAPPVLRIAEILLRCIDSLYFP